MVTLVEGRCGCVMGVTYSVGTSASFGDIVVAEEASSEGGKDQDTLPD
jgi:hypothetical protein